MTTKQHITNLVNNLPDINSVLEIQCGDGYDIENCQILQDKTLSYIGVDVVDEIIQDNRQYFRDEKNKIFMILDASNEPLPISDLVICTNMAPYLPIANIWSLLENIRDSEARYFAFNYNLGDKNLNSDIKIDGKNKPKKRGINLSKAPFYFPKPEFFVEDDEEDLVAIYDIAKVRFYMDWHNEDISKLRFELANRIDQDLNAISNAFEQIDNGEDLYYAMMVDFLSIEAKDHNQKYYYDEPYKGITDGYKILQNRNNIFRLVFKSDLESLIKEGYNMVNEDNFIHAQILTKDYIRCKFGLSIWID